MSKAGERLLAAAREMREGAWTDDSHAIFVAGGKTRCVRCWRSGSLLFQPCPGSVAVRLASRAFKRTFAKAKQEGE